VIPVLTLGCGLAFLLSGSVSVGASSALSSSVQGTTASTGTTTGSTTPHTSSVPHDSDRVTCGKKAVKPRIVDCDATFTDKKVPTEPVVSGQTVCFSVSPPNAGTFSPTCKVTGKKGKATVEFTGSGQTCGPTTITAREPAEGDSTSTTFTIKC
jgi:hypothetical protein